VIEQGVGLVKLIKYDEDVIILKENLTRILVLPRSLKLVK